VTRLPLQLALLVVALAFLGAFLHPLALLLALAPFDARGMIGALQAVREGIADLLGWGILAVLFAMAVYIAYERWFDRAQLSASMAWLPAPSPAHRRQQEHRAVVAITAFNDAEATADAAREFGRQNRVVKVLVIDNNSSDNTAELARKAGATVIREPKQGYGYTCIRGLSEALKVPGADVVLLTEGDGTFVADDVPKFLAYIDHAELVVGNRVVRGLVAHDSQMDSFFTWGNIAVAMLLRLRFWDGRFLGPAGLSDVGCTFRAIRRDSLERILPDLSVGGNHFSPHMLLVAFAHRLSVVEIPIRFRKRVGESKGASQSLGRGVSVGLSMIWHIFTYAPSRGDDRPGVLVERDGLVIQHAREFLPEPRIEFVPGSIEALANLSRRGHRIVVISDRSHYARAGATPSIARAIDKRIAAEVEHHGGHIEGFVGCTHTTGECECRQPRATLVARAAKQSKLDLTRSTVISDRPQFLEAAGALGCSTILVANKADSSSSALTRATDLAEAVEVVARDGDGGGPVMTLRGASVN
jgi:HAD superfamily hydrolase (TIGR01662 family)